MLQAGGDFRQRAQHKGIFSDLRPGQLNAVTLPHQVVIQQHINIQSPSTELGMAPVPPVAIFHLLQPAVQRGQRPVRVKACHQVVKRSPIKAHRLALVDGGDLQVLPGLIQSIQSRTDMPLPINVTANADVDPRHQLRTPRSMITPTSFAPRNAPGLLTRSRNQGTPNSSRTIRATSSAMVSTSKNSLASTKLIRRLETAL